jgi:hypothetical protein
MQYTFSIPGVDGKSQMPYVFLAHGALGALDELFPLLFGLGLIVLLVVAGFISRNREELPPETPLSEPSDLQGQPEASDHYRLD